MPNFWFGLQEWLKNFGLWFLEMRVSGTFLNPKPDEPGEEELPVINPVQAIPFEGYCILSGPVSEGGRRHMVVGVHAGSRFRTVHDPHPDKPGLVSVEAMCFLIPLNPQHYIRMGINMERIKELVGGPMTQPRWAAIFANAQEALGQSAIVTSGDGATSKGGRIIRG